MEVNFINQTFKVMKAWHGLNQRYHTWGALWHIFWAIFWGIGIFYYNCFSEEGGKYNFCEKNQFSSHSAWRTKRFCFSFCNIMVEERHRREPKGEVEEEIEGVGEVEGRRHLDLHWKTSWLGSEDN